MALFFKNKNNVDDGSNIERMKEENESLKYIVKLQEEIRNYSSENSKLLNKINELEEMKINLSSQNSSSNLQEMALLEENNRIIKEENQLLIEKYNEAVMEYKLLDEKYNKALGQCQLLEEKYKEAEKKSSEMTTSTISLRQLEVLEKNLRGTKEENRILMEKRTALVNDHEKLTKEYEQLEKKYMELTSSTISLKQMELMERNLKNARNENLELKEKLSHFEEVGTEVMKIQVEEVPKEFSQNVIILDKFKYKISIEDFYPGVKFKELRDILSDEGINTLDEIEDFENILNLETAKNYLIGKQKFENYKKEIVSIEDRISLCKGSKIAKIVKTPKKFATYLAENNIEFMDDLENADIMALCLKAGIGSKSVKGMLTLIDEYFEKNKIS